MSCAYLRKKFNFFCIGVLASIVSPVLYGYDDIRDKAERWAHERIWTLDQGGRNIIAQYLYYRMAQCDLELMKYYENYPYPLCTHFDTLTVKLALNNLIKMLSSEPYNKTKTALIVSRLQKYIEKQSDDHEFFLRNKVYHLTSPTKSDTTVLKMHVLEHQRYIIWIFYSHLYWNLDMSDKNSRRFSFVTPFVIADNYQLPDPYNIRFSGSYRHYTIPPAEFCMKHSKEVLRNNI